MKKTNCVPGEGNSLFKNKKTDGILRSETYLSPDYVPDQPIGRKKEIKQIADSVRPLTRNKQPENLLLHGPAGVGKTTCTKHVLRNLETETRVETIHLNCWKYDTVSSLLTQITIELGYPTPRKGISKDELLQKIQELLHKKDSVAIALDEFDKLEKPGEALYHLKEVSKKQEKSKIGFIMISNQEINKIINEERTKSRLNHKQIKFGSYNTQQLTKILQKRVEQAFKPGSIEKSQTKKIAEEVAQKNGDCRLALKILLTAARKTDRNQQNKMKDQILKKTLQENL